MKVTDEHFWEYIDNLPADEFEEILCEDRQGLIENYLTKSSLNAYKKAYWYDECYWCCDCGEYFTDIEDLNDEDLCEDCREYEETQMEKAQQEHSEVVKDEK